jgi:tetratricopeptide (TPR) repeat protein
MRARVPFAAIRPFCCPLALAFLVLIVVPGLAQDKASLKAWQSDLKVAEDAFAGNQFRRAAELYQAALADAKTFPTNDARLSSALRKQARACENAGDLAAAISAQWRALLIDQGRLGTNDYRLAEDLIGLGEKCSYAQRFDEADEYYLRAESLVERKFGKFDATVGICKESRARTAMMDNRFADAERLFQEAVELLNSDRIVFHFRMNANPSRTVVSTPKSALAGALNDLGVLYLKEKKLSDAEKALNRSLHLAEADLGKKSLVLCTALGNLSQVYFQQGRLPLAEQTLRRSLDIMADVEPDNPQVVKTRSMLAAVQRAEEATKSNP